MSYKDRFETWPPSVHKAKTFEKQPVYDQLSRDDPFQLFTYNFTEPYPPGTELRKVWTTGDRRYFENNRGEVYSCSLTELWQWQAHPEPHVCVPLSALQNGLLELKYGDFEGPDFETNLLSRQDKSTGKHPTAIFSAKTQPNTMSCSSTYGISTTETESDIEATTKSNSSAPFEPILRTEHDSLETEDSAKQKLSSIDNSSTISGAFLRTEDASLLQNSSAKQQFNAMAGSCTTLEAVYRTETGSEFEILHHSNEETFLDATDGDTNSTHNSIDGQRAGNTDGGRDNIILETIVECSNHKLQTENGGRTVTGSRAPDDEQTNDWDCYSLLVDEQLSLCTNEEDSSSFSNNERLGLATQIEEGRLSANSNQTSSLKQEQTWEFVGNEDEDQEIMDDNTEDVNEETKTLMSTQSDSQGWLQSSMNFLWSFLPSCAAASLASQNQKHMKVLADLEDKIRSKYWKEISNWPDMYKQPITSVFDLRESYSKEGSPRKVICDSTLFNLQTTFIKGRPLYGKTTICSLIRFSWTYQNIPSHRLCVYLSLSNIDPSATLEDKILSIVDYDSGGQFHIDDIRDAFKSIEISILLIFDDYDKLTSKGKDTFYQFLFNRNTFLGATVLVTGRPTTDKTFMSRFEQVLEIQGFSSSYLKEALTNGISDKKKITEFEHGFCENGRLICLNGMPPYFVYDIVEMVKTDAYNEAKMCTVFQLLKETLRQKHLLVQNQKVTYEVVCASLGKMFFKALVRGYFYFTDSLLDTVGVDISAIKNFIFYKEDCEDESVWTVCHKLFMVYFATEYLKQAWAKLTKDEEREHFLQNAFCDRNSTGDFVLGNGVDPCLYYVGIIPEICLKFEHPYDLNKTTFEMVHDGENVETSNSFDSLNMLLRFSELHLIKYNFVRLDGDNPEDECYHMFENILNCLSFPNSCVYYEFYHNSLEYTNFVRILVENPDEKGNEFHVICRADSNNKIDRFYVDFSDSVIADVSQFLFKYLFSQEDRTLKSSSSVEFVFDLLSSLAKMELACTATVICSCDNQNPGQKTKVACVTFKVIPNEKSKVIEMVSLSTNTGMFASRTYNTNTLRGNDILRTLREIAELEGTLRVCLNLMFL